ncbi:MAG: dockerin type I domain-containing protein [Pirellulaceae bacterium]
MYPGSGWLLRKSHGSYANDNPKPFQNPQNHLNVNNDAANEVSPIDVGIIITDLNTNGSRTLDYPSTLPEFFLDVNGDNSVSPIDALLVINHLNDNLAGEGEAFAADASLLSVVANALQASGERPANRTNSPAATSNEIHKSIADVDSLADQPVGELSSLDTSARPIGERRGPPSTDDADTRRLIRYLAVIHGACMPCRPMIDWHAWRASKRDEITLPRRRQFTHFGGTPGVFDGRNIQNTNALSQPKRLAPFVSLSLSLSLSALRGSAFPNPLFLKRRER